MSTIKGRSGEIGVFMKKLLHNFVVVLLVELPCLCYLHLLLVIEPRF